MRQFCIDTSVCRTSEGAVPATPSVGLRHRLCWHGMALFLSPSTCPWNGLWIGYCSQPPWAADEKPMVSETAASPVSLVPKVCLYSGWRSADRDAENKPHDKIDPFTSTVQNIPQQPEGITNTQNRTEETQINKCEKGHRSAHHVITFWCFSVVVTGAIWNC